MKLYGSKNSRSLRCVWALEEAGATYDYQRVNMMKGEGYAPAYKAVNPLGKIPAFQDGDLTLTESMAIVQYVADIFPQSPLLPGDAATRAQIHRWVYYAVTEVEPHLWAVAQHRFALPEDKRVPALEPTTVWQLERSLRPIEKALTAQPYIAGAVFSMADVVVFHCLVWALSAKLQGVGVASLLYIERLKTRPAYQAAMERERLEAEKHDVAGAAH